mmetsp:Transcript_32075/g.92151  ORF Transcript_32075/g.92151 Transcript_32075/m.92151 type:complete len:218 (+) Transcript_32075:118-771(+)
MPSFADLFLWIGAWAQLSKSLELKSSVDLRKDGSKMASNKVHVEFFVMSKCPDAITCEDAFGPVLKELASAVNVSFEYIGSPKSGCMHGPSECAGDIQQLCAQAEAGSVSQLIDFVLCQSQDRQKIPDNGEECIAHAGYNAERMDTCIHGNKGMDMLKKSFGVSQSRGIGLSCTVSVNGEEFCAHDGDWVECSACDAHDDKGTCLRDKICGLVPGAC